MTSSRPVLDNQSARRLFMARHALADDPGRRQSKACLLDLIRRLGFVQIDSIQTVIRAHHLILLARNQTYQPKHLVSLLERDRALFENWTHDASIVPTDFFPYWRRRFVREAEKLKERWRSWRRDGFEAEFETILDHVRENGGCMARHMGAGDTKASSGWWDWHPSKTALEYLWRTGHLAVCRREGFQKVYDLVDRVIPVTHRSLLPDDEDLVAWSCSGALERLGFATSGELAAFWDGISPSEAAEWCSKQASDDLIEVDIEMADGGMRRVYADPALIDDVKEAPEPPGRIRVLSPFDPLIRDRKRTHRLFGFQYTIEVFVPAAKRRYGYYVFPLLEGDRLIGRVDMKCQRETGTLTVTGLWLEQGVKAGKGRLRRLEAELERIGRFTDCRSLDFDKDWRKD
ncbi:MAG: crosslink repair DNA glycosylase YcaQ family protein [Pseudomonadota bacterium]